MEEYRKNIDEILEFLGGNYGILTKKLSAAMQEASENLEFEKAAEYRDLLNSVNKLSQQQKVSDTEGSNRDIIAFATAGDEGFLPLDFLRILLQHKRSVLVCQLDHALLFAALWNQNFHPPAALF